MCSSARLPCLPLCVVLCPFQLGSWGDANFQQVLRVFLVIVSVGFGIAEAISIAPDFASGSAAIQSVFAILDRQTAIEPNDPTAEKVEKIEGTIELRGVRFVYPTRPDVTVFEDFNLLVSAHRQHPTPHGSTHHGTTVVHDP